MQAAQGRKRGSCVRSFMAPLPSIRLPVLILRLNSSPDYFLRNPGAGSLFMICSNIKLNTAGRGQFELRAARFIKENQRDFEAWDLYRKLENPGGIAAKIRRPPAPPAVPSKRDFQLTARALGSDRAPGHGQSAIPTAPDGRCISLFEGAAHQCRAVFVPTGESNWEFWVF